MNNCDKCNNEILINDLIACANCKRSLHYKCAGIEEKGFRKMLPMNKMKWKCTTCKEPKLIITPQKDTHSILSLDFDKLTTYIDKKFENFDKQFQRLKEDIQTDFLKRMESEMTEIKLSIDFMSEKFDKSKATLDEKIKLIIELQNDNKTLKTENLELSNRLSTLEQHSRESNVEIQCVPEHSSENLVNLSIQLASAVSGSLQESDIMAVHRVAKMNRDSNRPRSIILRLRSPRCRDALLAAVKTYNKANPSAKLNSSHLGIGGSVPSPVYVSEHLIPATRQLHAATRQFSKTNGIKFVWVRNGKVFLRKDEQSHSCPIYNLDTLKHIKY